MWELGSTSFTEDPICSQDADTTYLGRPVHQYTCGEFTYLIDEETGLLLYEQGPGSLREVLSIEFDAEFDEALFTVEPPTGAVNLYEDPRPSSLLGQSAPPMAGTLLDGGTYDTSDWADSRVAVLFWASWCGACVDALAALQAASDQAGEDIVFVTVLTFDDPQAGRDAVTFTGATLPVVDDPEVPLRNTTSIMGTSVCWIE